MIRRLLIANRGEIACRIARTARRMGIETVAVASPVDRASAHVAACDMVAMLPANAPVGSYLRGDLILQAAKMFGADAIHPGYGFLSEDPDFAQSVNDAGLIWVGPSADAIRKMGLKDAAKALMATANVPIVPGYHGADQSVTVLSKAAQDIGYPVLIKAVAGGGGKGMRLVNDMAEFASQLAAAQSEAKAAFGNDRVLIEKFISSPRHIEIQIFGDGADAVHLFERDCSLQRRHQKVVEEAPAPGMTEEVRRAMGQAAVNAAKAIGYSGAGTVEFIVDGTGALTPDSFFFMEMNTRLQVEHPVTEEILGIDLVEWQLNVAAGGALPLAQSDIHATGHAVEVRLYAENPYSDFLPSTGELVALGFGEGLRIETGVRVGDVVSPYYDPMIAKIIATGPTRDQALNKLAVGLLQTHVDGIHSNRDFLIQLLKHPEFRDGTFDTGLIARDITQLTQAPEATDADWAIAAVSAMGLPNPSVGMPLQGYSGFTLQRHSICIAHGDETKRIGVEIRNQNASVFVDDETILLNFDGRWTAGGFAPNCVTATPQSVTLFREATLTFSVPDPLQAIGERRDENAVTSPMPGLVQSVFVTVGDQVEAGAPLLILEAMKMQHRLEAPRDGIIQSLPVVAGDQVDAGQLLVGFVIPE